MFSFHDSDPFSKSKKQNKYLFNVLQGKEDLSLKGFFGLEEENPKKTKTGSVMLDSFIDNCIKDLVEPRRGSIVHCGLCANQVEHSGIYVGNNKIVHLDGTGLIEEVTPQQFLDRFNGLDLSMSIYVSCKKKKVARLKAAAIRAKMKVGKKVKYNVLTNNCHKFSSGCLTGNFDNSDTFFSDLEEVATEVIGLKEWKVWDFR